MIKLYWSFFFGIIHIEQILFNQQWILSMTASFDQIRFFELNMINMHHHRLKDCSINY